MSTTAAFACFTNFFVSVSKTKAHEEFPLIFFVKKMSIVLHDINTLSLEAIVFKINLKILNISSIISVELIFVH